MPDATVFIRPDVTINAAVPATVSHPRVHDFTNAVRVQQAAADLGIVEIRVGYGLNANITLGVETTAAGVGNAVTLRAGDAVGGGPSAGGTITLQPGVGVGGGAHGNVVPYADNVFTLGTGALAFANVFTEGVQPPIGGDLELWSSDGFALWIHSDLATGVLFGPTTYRLTDFGTLQFGSAPDVSVAWVNASSRLEMIVANGTGAAGLGGSVYVQTGAALAASGLAGGDVITRTGLGDGAGARGVIRWDDAGTAMSVLPTTTNLVTVGNRANGLALAGLATRVLSADTGQSLLIVRGNGATVITVSNASTIAVDAGIVFSAQATILDNVSLAIGSGTDVQARWATASANNALHVATGVNSAAQSGNILLTTTANIANEHGLAAVATPRFSIFSAADMSVAGNRTQYIQMYNDGTDGRVATGAQRLTLASGGGTIRLSPAEVLQIELSSGNSGATAVIVTQRVNASGTPTGLLWTAGAHTGLANASLNDWNIDLSRTVTFLGGGATSFALYAGVAIDAPTLGAVTAGLTVTDSATVRIAGPPVAEDGDITLTRAHSLLVAAGQVTVVATLVVGANVAITAGHAAQIGGKLRMTDVINFDFARIDGAGAPPVFDDVPAAYSPTQVGWLEIEVEDVSGLVPFFPVV